MYYYYSLVVYYFVGFLAFRKNRSQKSRKRQVFFALLPAFLLVALRSVAVGNDSYSYFYAFESYKELTSFTSILEVSIREPGFLLLNLIFSKLGLSYYFLQIAIAAFTFYSIGRFIVKYSTDIWLSCLLFILNRHMFGTMNTMRMWLAIAIVLFAVPFILRKKRIYACIVCLVAMLFHFVAIVFMVLVFFVDFKWNTQRFLALLLIAGIISLLGRSFFSVLTNLFNRYSSYLNGRYFESGGLATYISLVIQLCLTGFIYCEYRTKWRHFEVNRLIAIHDEKVRFDGYLMSCMMMMLLLDIVGMNNTIMSRISAFFAPCIYISVPYALSTLGKTNRRLLSLFIVIVLIIEFIVVMELRPGWYGVSEYTFIWQESYW